MTKRSVVRPEENAPPDDCIFISIFSAPNFSTALHGHMTTRRWCTTKLVFSKWNMELLFVLEQLLVLGSAFIPV